MPRENRTKDEMLTRVDLKDPPVWFDKNNKVVYKNVEYQPMLVSSQAKDKVFQFFAALPELLQDSIRSNEALSQLLIVLAHQQEQILALQVELNRLQHGLVGVKINQQITDTVNKAIDNNTALENSRINIKIAAAVTTSGEKAVDAKHLNNLNSAALHSAKVGLKGAFDKLAGFNVDYNAERKRASEAMESLESVERTMSHESFELLIDQTWNTKPHHSTEPPTTKATVSNRTESK